MRSDDPALPLIFRVHQIDLPGRRNGVCWQAMLFDGPGQAYPCAIAWLSDYRYVAVPLGMVLDFIVVPDKLRRKGYAAQLVQRCRARWPELVLTDPISEAGAGLVERCEAADVQGDKP
jgi:hypothetical protein